MLRLDYAGSGHLNQPGLGYGALNPQQAQMQMLGAIMLAGFALSGGNPLAALNVMMALYGALSGRGPGGFSGFGQDNFGRSFGSSGVAPMFGQGAPRGTVGAGALGRQTGNTLDVARFGSAAVGSNGVISERSKNLILKSEGLDQPGRHPGGASGVTIGHGYDLGYKSRAELRRDWGGRIPESQLRRLEQVVGLKGAAAKRAAAGLRDIRIDPSTARQVFDQVTLPKWIDRTRKTFPGFDRLNADQKGALVSVVFNRGTSMKGGRRLEMRQLREAVARNDAHGMASALRRMKRLWVGKGLDGLLVRRDREAALMVA